MKNSVYEYYCNNPALLIFRLGDNTFLRLIDDKRFLRWKYRVKIGKPLDIDNPKTFNEKMQWLKLYYRKPILTELVDKGEAKKYIRDRIGDKYVIETLGIWNSFEEIDFDALPNEFVLKCTHDSGGLIICRNKKQLDKNEASKIINNSLRHNYFWSGREWPYKNVKPRIIAEPLIRNDDNSQLVEYNFFCFNGEPRFLMRCSGDRDKGEQRYNDYFDIEGKKLPFSWGYPYSDAELVCDEVYYEMLDKSKILSKDFPFVRVDFYVCNQRPLMGELTFFHWGGMMKVEPDNWDRKIGNYLHLPENENI